MFDLGDELVIESDAIPWLIWIQLLVMLLLIILLYYTGVYALGLDLSSNAAAAAASPSTALLPSDGLSSRHHSPFSTGAAAATVTSLLHQTKVGEGYNSSETGTSSGRRRARREDTRDREGSSSGKGTAHASALERSYHPCHYLGLAKQAFLKCLGLDPASKNSSNVRQRKEE